MKGSYVWQFGLIFGAVVTIGTQPVSATTRYVSNTGADGGACGTSSSPCRSITQAITNAGAGDSVSVGPGLYGDINNDGALGGVGEEPNVAVCLSSDSCMLRVTKSVKIYSTDGAGATVVRVPNALVFFAVVIEAPGTTFGKVNKGFTVLGGTETQILASADDIIIAGNRVIVDTPSPSSSVGISASGARLLLRGNVVQGIGASESDCIAFSGDGGRVIANVVKRCGRGIWSGATTWTMAGNIAADNEVGVSIRIFDGPPNVASGPPALFDKNAMIANTFAGVRVDALNNPPGGTTIALSRGNVFANGEDAMASAPNCGLYVRNIDVTDAVTVTADEFFWGAAAGPGANPADAIGGSCSTGAGMATVNATNPVPKRNSIKAPAQR